MNNSLTAMSGMNIRRRYALVEFLSWLPIGLMIAPQVLLMAHRGLSVAEIGVTTAVFSVTVVALELPTGGLADVIGRRTVLAASAAFTAAGMALMSVATTLGAFLAAAALKGVARALSSGPAQAWYVDMLHEAEGPGADLKPGLARGGFAGAAALAVGTLLGGAIPQVTGSLTLPAQLGAGAAAVLLGTVLFAMPSPRRPRVPARAVLAGVPSTVLAGARLGLRDRGLGRLLLIAVATGVMLNLIEMLTPLRLGSAGAYSLVAALGFGANAAGSALAPLIARRLRSSVATAIAGTVVTSAAVAALAATAALTGTAAIVCAALAYVLIFTGLAVSELIHTELMHLRVGSAHRATVMSVESLLLRFGGMASALALGPLTALLGLSGTWTLAAVLVLASALLYLRLPAPAGADHGTPSRTRFGQGAESGACG
ncbi:MFS transporter [Streptosporangiaceae bacterium NEAU-GS5]|nr:MFS transporter [Streptosporangiaceae bacterium NEAU-GS5]